MQVKAISACPGTVPAMSADVSVVFSVLYAEHFRGLVALVWRRVDDWALAEDLTQAMFVKLWADVAAGTVDLTGVGFGWLANRAMWAVGSHYRLARVRAEAAMDDATTRMLADRTDDPLALVTARIGVGQLILTLPFQPRRALALCLLEDMPVCDVAHETGLSEHEVKAHLAEGLTRLRELLGARPSRPRRGRHAHSPWPRRWRGWPATPHRWPSTSDRDCARPSRTAPTRSGACYPPSGPWSSCTPQQARTLTMSTRRQSTRPWPDCAGKAC